jgi:hypothetical protein
MIIQARIAARNSLLLIGDREAGEIPESFDDKLVVSTPSCIAVGTLPEMDGETSIILTDEKNCADADPALRRIFSGALATPNKEVHVYTVLEESVAKLPLPGNHCAVEVWADDETEPHRLCVVVNA